MDKERVEHGDKSPEVGTLVDYVYDATTESPLKVEVAINDDGRVLLFHNKVFRNELSWLEFDLGTSELDFILDGGITRDFGMPLDKSVSKHMQNTHQVLTVLLDEDTGDAKEGHYIPLILHKT